jgi:hypothetical protein
MRRTYQAPKIVDLKPTWVRVGVWAAVISFPTRRRHGVPYEPSWLVLGPKRDDKPMRPTVASGRAVTRDGLTELVTCTGELPEDLAPALLEAACALVHAAAAQLQRS